MIGTTLLNLVTIVLGGAGASKKLKGVSKLDDLENVDDLSKLGNLENVDDLGKLGNIDNMEGSALVDDVGKGGKGRSGAEGKYSAFGDMSEVDGLRYNQYWDDVAKGLDTDARVKLNQWEYRPTAESYIKHESAYNNPRYFNQTTGEIHWPENRGFDSEPVSKILQPGMRIDRYGYEGGTFVSPEGTPYTNRALSPGTENKPYRVYEVVKPIEVQSGTARPWFDEAGGGTQYEFNKSIADLLDEEIIREVK